jgi:hypothetical protein
LQRLTALQTSSLTKRERVPAAKHDCQQAGRYPRAVPTEKRCTTPSHRLSLSKLDAPPELSASIRFDAWLRDEAFVTNRHIQATRFSAYSGQYAAVTSIS